jgi:serine/threonine protein kinase
MFLSKGQVYLILDYEDGGNLLEKIKQQDFLTMKDKIKFLVDMLNAFEFLRIKGIIHRDLKPENILYSKKDNCYKIADFSLAIFENETTNKIVGTPGYLAP